MLLLLMYHDVDLTREILKTFKKFLDIRRQGELIGLVGSVPSAANMRKSISMSSFGEFARQKIGSVGKLLFTEFHKMFSSGNALPIERHVGDQIRIPSSVGDIQADLFYWVFDLFVPIFVIVDVLRC